MAMWEYTTFLIKWDTKKNEWGTDFQDVNLNGFATILNYYGQQGWELVNIVPNYQEGKVTRKYGFGGGLSHEDTWNNVEAYRAVFKRVK